MVEHDAGDTDAEIAHIGEVGQPQTTRRMLLPEDDVALGTVEGPPGANAPLQGTATPVPISAWRRWISSNTATGRKPGTLCSSGTTSLSHTAASGSGRRRPRGAFFCDGSR